MISIKVMFRYMGYFLAHPQIVSNSLKRAKQQDYFELFGNSLPKKFIPLKK